MTSRKQLAINQRALYDDAVKNKMFWNATPSFQEFQRRLQNPKYVQTVQANYRAHGRSGDAFDTLSGFRDYFCVSDEDKQDMTQGVGNMIADTKARLAGQQRYNKLKQHQDKQRGRYGRLDLGVKNPLTNDNVVRDDATDTYLTSQGAEYAQEYEAARAQNQLDEINDSYTEAVKRGDLPSAFEVRDKDGNYALVEDLGVKPGVHVTEKGKQQQLAGLVNTRKNVEEQYNALYRKLEEDFKRSAPFSLNTHSQYGIDDNDMRLQAYLNSNAQYRRLKAQLHQLDNAIGVGKEAVKGRAEERYVKNAKGMLGYAYRDLKSFGASALRGLWNAVSDVSTWDLGLQDLQDNMTLYTTVKKARQKGYKNLNSEERQMLDVAAKTGAYTAENQQYLGRGYKAGNVTGESLPFMVEMALNPASGLGEAVMSKYMRNAIAKYGKEAVRKEAWKYVTKKCGYRVAGDVLGAALMTGTTGSARTLADTYDRLTGDIKSTYDSNGKIVYDGTENEEKGILKAYLKAFGATAIENHSEFVGEYFNPLLKGVGTLTMKGWKKVNAKSANAFLDNLKDMGSTSTAKWLGNLFDKTQWHGTIGEYAEEVVGNIENALLVGDSTLDTKEGTGVFNLDQNIDTFLGVSLMGGFFSTLKTGAYVRDKVKGERKILMQQSLDLDNSIRYALGADPRLSDKWKEWRVALAQGTDEEKKQALKEISENTNGNIKKAMYDYSANAQKLAGMDKATQGAIEDGTITPEQAQRDADIEQAHEEGLAAEGTARHDIQQEHQLKENSLARMLGISAEQLDRMEDEDIESMTGQNDALDTAIYDYQTSRERYQGVIDRATDEVEQAGIDAAHQIDLYTDHSTGQIRPCVIKGNNGKEDYQGYIVNGNIATHPDGAIDVSGSDKMILYFDPETGKIEHGDASTFASLGESADATVARQQAIDEAKQQAAQAQSRDIDGGVGEDGNVSEAMPTFPQSSDHEERNAADFDIGQVVNAETGEVIPVSFEGLAEGENAYLTGGRPDGKTKDRLKVTIVDAEGNVTNRVMKRGNVQVDGRMSAEDFRNAYEEAVSSRMAPEADMNGQENNVNEEGVVDGDAAPSADKAATSEEEGAASEPAVRDKNGNPIYDKMPISATIADLYDGALDDAEIDGFVSAQIAEAEKAVEKMEKKKPKVGTDKAKYLADKKAWEEGLQEAQRKVQYWQDVKAEVEKITTPEDARGYEEELNGDAAQTAYRNGSDAAAYGAREVTAEFMQSGDVKITPESYRKETGFGAAEQRAMVGKISKGGKSIDKLAEDLEVFDRENYNGMYFGGDSSVAKDAILDYLSSPDSRKGVKKMQSEAEREYVEAYEAERDRYYQEKYHMSYEEYLVYSSQEMPELLRKYSNFDEQLFLERYADEIEAALQKREEQLKQEENGKEGNVSAGEESGHGRSNQVQSGERTDDIGRGEVGKDSAGEVGPRHEGVVESEAASKETITPEQQSLLSRRNSSQYTAERESSDHKVTNSTDTKQENEEKSAKALSNKQSSGQAKMSHKEKTGEKEAMSPTPAMIDRMIEEQRVDDVSELLISSELKKAAEGIAEAFGMKVVYLKKVFIKSDDPAVEDFEGNGFVRNGVIYLSLKEANIAQFTFGHELLHQLKQIDADSYMRIRQKVIDVMGRKAFEMEVKARQMTYANVPGYTLFEDYAEEVIADTLGDIITHTDMLPNIARSLKDNPSLLDRLLKVVDNVRQYFRGKTGGALGDIVNDIRNTYEMTARQGAERDKFSLRLAEAKNNTDKNPSQAQKESGNYRKGHIRFGGYNYTIENPQGSYRSGVDENGKKWKQKMNNTYGYILGTKGKDGDHLDMFINDNADLDSWNGNVYVVDQIFPDGSFDEHKVMYGFDSEEEARKAYLSNYEQGWQGLGNITGVSKEDFDRWLEKSGRKTKAFSEYKNVKSESAESPKTGAFGTVYTQFRGKAQEAIAFLLEKKEGEAVGALHHKDIGDIDLVWGKEGTAKSDGFGLAKLAKYHPEVLGNLQEILDAMVVVKRTDNRVKLESETHQASVRLTWDSEKKNWLLTAFEKKNSVSDNTTDTVGTAEGGKRNDTATPQNTVSDGKDTEKDSSEQEDEEKKASGDRPLYASLGVSRSLGEEAAEGEREATSVRLQNADIVDAEAMAEEYGLDADDVRRYAEGMRKGSSAQAARALAEISRKIIAAHEDEIHSLLDMRKFRKPVEKALKEAFGDVDVLIEERRKQIEEERNTMEAARKRAEEEQRKREVRLEELAVLTDEEIDRSYAEALAKGDVAAAREMLDEAARRKGYGDVRSDYQGVGAWSAPSNPDYETDEARRNAVGEDSPDLNVEDMAAGYSNQPEDIFVHPNKYSQGLPTSKESGNAIQTAIDDIRNGKKDVTVKVYRAVPTSVKEGKLRNGDWVTPSRKYAELHGSSRLEGKYRIIEDEVPVSELWWDGNDVNEWGYDNGKGYRYKNVKNNRKLNDLVTRDDNGNVIPPSKRFNQRKADERYQRVVGGVKPSKAEAVLRDAVIDRLRENGMEVITDVAEGQKVLDEANGEEVMLSAKQKRALETATMADESTNKATVVSSADGAKVQNNLEILADSYKNRPNKAKGFITDLSRSLGLEQHEASQYGTFVTENGKTVTIRVSNHNARVSFFDKNGENDGISIVISNHKNKGLLNDGNAHIIEFFYSKQSLQRADSKPLSDIIRSVSEALYSGEFKDTTGLAERQEVNAKQIREQRMGGADGLRFFRTANGEAYGFTVGGKIYVDPRIATSETPVHEYAHLWATALRSGNKEEWQNVVGLMKDSKVWDEVKGRYPELKTDDEIADEVIATYSGLRGAERLREEQRKIAEGDGGVFEKAEAISALEKVKLSLKRFWKGVADFLHIHYKSAEEVADRVMKDLLEGVDPRKMGDGVDRQRYASLGVSRSLGEEAGEGEPRWASSSLSEQQLDGDDTIRFSLNYDKWDREMASWLKRNRLPKNAQRPVVPQREAGESDLHFAGRLAKYNQDKALWNTAPKYEGHLSSGMTARGEFNYELQRGSVLARIAAQDSMLAIRKAQEAIARHSGLLKVGTFEDAYMAENNSHGKAKNEFEQYDQEYLEPLRKWFNVMMKRLDGSYNNVTNYMIAKHGLERNAHMAFMAALEAEAKKAIGNTQPDAKRLRAQMVHDAYRQYKADSRRLINDADYEAGKYDYAQWRRTDDAIRKSYCSNYESFRYDKGGVVRDYAGLSSLFQNETDFEEKAAELCADIESKNGHETSELWDAVRQATRQILKNSHDAGMMSDETYDYVRGMYEHYIPLRGWNDSAADEVWDYAGGGRGVFNAALKEAHGRQSLADDPVAYIMNMAESGFLVNNRNWVKQHFLTMAMNHPTDLLTVSKAWYVKTKDQFGNEVWIPASPNIPADETDPAVIEAALNAFQTKMEQMEQSGDATQQRGSLNIEYPQTKSEEREHEVRVMKDGEEYVVYVNGDPQLAQALNNTRAMRVREHEGNFEKACAWLGRKMAAVYTSLSPLFVPSNWARDTTMTLASTAIREDARYNWLLRTKFMRPDVQMRMFGLVKEYQNGKLREKVKSNKATKMEENFWNFMINGGETGFVSTMDVDAFREKIQRDLKDMGRTRLNPVKVGHTIADSVEYINRVIEDSNRFAIYQTSIEYGRGIEEAVQDAKNVTLNFNRKGTGEMGMSAIRQLYLFINPAIQSLQTLGALAKDHKAKFTAVTSAWMASGMLVPLFNELMFNLASAAAGGGGDDDDEFNPKDEYWKFSSFDRRNNCILWIPFTHDFIKIPLAQEFRGFYGIGDMVASAMWGGENAKESWSNYAADLMGQIIDLSPLDPVSYDGNVLVSLMPNAIRPLVEIAQNVTFTGKPIYRESDFNKYDPSFKKAYAGTPDFLLRYSKWMNSIGNKYPEAQQGPVEQTAVGRYANNPAVIDHLLKSYLGGMYTLGSQIAGAITKASDEETRKDFKTADIPFFSKFVANPNDRPQSKNKGDAYWQDFEKYQRSSHTLGVIRQDARKTGNFSVLEDFYKSEEYKEMKEYEPKAKQRKEEQKYERWKEEGNADLYQPHQQTGEDVYKRHSTPADDFEDTKASILYQKIKPAKDIFDLADVNTPSGMDTFNKYYDLAGKVEEAHSVKKEMNAIVKSFVDGEHKATFDPEKMKEYRALRKQYVQLVEEGNRMFEKIKAQRN